MNHSKGLSYTVLIPQSSLIFWCDWKIGKSKCRKVSVSVERKWVQLMQYQMLKINHCWTTWIARIVNGHSDWRGTNHQLILARRENVWSWPRDVFRTSLTHPYMSVHPQGPADRWKHQSSVLNFINYSKIIIDKQYITHESCTQYVHLCSCLYNTVGMNNSQLYESITVRL